MVVSKQLALCLAFIFFALACQQKSNPTARGKVYIGEHNGAYTLYRNGTPYEIKGASGYTQLDILKEMGGNTIRVWDTVGLKGILDDALLNNMTVIVGLPIPNNKNFMTFYNDSTKVARQHYAFKTIVNRFKDHPAVLMWCLGNELDFPYRPAYNNFYRAFNDLTDMIHQDDPNHPVTTTLMNFNKKYIFNLTMRCNLDIISFNVFSLLSEFRENLEEASWFWKGPFMITEWGINGPWDEGTRQTAWGAYIEDSSNKKAEFVSNRYHDLPIENQRFLGSFIFYWGQKQEGTPTWFSLFDEEGQKSEIVRVMNEIWTNKSSDLTFLNIKYMLVNGKGSEENIMLSSGSTSQAELLLVDSAVSIKTVKWEILKEDWYRKNEVHSTKKLHPIENLIIEKDKLNISFKAPNEEGPYRIYVTAYSSDGNFSTCNTPFYVIGEQ